MAAAVGDRVWKETAPEAVERELGALWRDLSGRGPVARAVMSNLVMFRLRDRRTAARETDHGHGPDIALDAVIARHPSRAIVIEHERGEHDVCGPLGASVGIIVFGPPEARYAVEEIVVRSACAEPSLPSIVRRYLRGDVPTSIWWTEDLSRVPPLGSLVAMGRQLVYDSRGWRDVRAGLRVIAPLVADERLDLADLNWRRLTPLRRALAHALCDSPHDVSPSDVQIAYRPGEGALAWLFAGWLAARLGWPAGTWPRMSEARQNHEILTVAIRAGRSTTSGSLNGHRARVEQPGAAPFIVGVSRETDAEAVAAELRTLSFEAALRDTLVALTART